MGAANSLNFQADCLEVTVDITTGKIPLDTPLLREELLPFKDTVARAILAGCRTFGDIAALPSGKAAVAPEAVFSAAPILGGVELDGK